MAQLKYHHLFLTLSFFLGFVVATHAQNQVLQGRILDETTNEPLAFASVYYNNSTIGGQSDAEGRFKIPFLGLNYELIVSYVGYETFKYQITQAFDDRALVFKLEPATKTIKEVAISAPRSEIWYKNLEIFTQHIIGASYFSEECKILNPEVMQFYYDTATMVMRAYAKDLLKLENEALGYRINYALQDYRFNVISREFMVSGHPFFIPLQGNRAQHERWDFNRQVAYEGSLLHFIRSLFRDSTAQLAFEVKQVRRLPNPAYEDDEKIIAARNALKQMPYYQAVKRTNPHQRVLMRADREQYVEKIDPKKLPLSKYTTSQSQSLALSFQDYLRISYEKVNPFRNDQKVTVYTDIKLLKPYVRIHPTGRIIDAEDMYFEGYWGSKLLGDMLPFDYIPAW